MFGLVGGNAPWGCGLGALRAAFGFSAGDIQIISAKTEFPSGDTSTWSLKTEIPPLARRKKLIEVAEWPTWGYQGGGPTGNNGA